MDPEEVFTIGRPGRRAGSGISDEDTEFENLATRVTGRGGPSTKGAGYAASVF